MFPLVGNPKPGLLKEARFLGKPAKSFLNKLSGSDSLSLQAQPLGSNPPARLGNAINLTACHQPRAPTARSNLAQGNALGTQNTRFFLTRRCPGLPCAAPLALGWHCSNGDAKGC
jgi:hypothetical protein